MKKILWIACLLCMMPFIGYAQFNHAQSDEELFGQATISTELPAQITLKGIEPKRDGNPVWAHAMYVPPKNYNFGRYYEVDADGTITDVRRYNDWYYSSAEYYANAELNANPVWAYANDYTRGFMTLAFNDGMWVEGEPIAGGMNTMNDIAWDYHNMRMLGVKFGRIYEVTLTVNNALSGQTTLIYDYADHDGLKPITIAVDLNGDVYFVSTSDGEENSHLYKFANTDVDLQTPIDLGELTFEGEGWPARKIQTMAFDHNEGLLYWWACKEDENLYSHSRLFEVNKETAELTDVSEEMTTEIAGLFFEFDYSPHIVHLFPGTGGTIATADGESAYYPGVDVTITSAANGCMHITGMTVYKTGDHSKIVASTFNAATGECTFVMPAYDVDVVAEWAGNVHNITYQWTPTGVTNLNISGPATATCGSNVVVNYKNTTGYILTGLTATSTCETNIAITGNQNLKRQFTMPDCDVTVNGTYQAIELEQLPDVCQFQAPGAPEFNIAPANYTSYVFKVKKAGTSSWVNYTAADMANGEKFNVAGTWQYRVEITNAYGTFKSANMSFQVYAAPRSVAITGNQYCCDGDSIVLNVVGDPASVVLNGSFVWKKGNTVVETTNVPVWKKFNIAISDAGVYSVTFTPATNTNEPLCEFTSDPYEVNVATLPNKPLIHLLDAENPICYNSSVTVAWDHGVLHTWEYQFQWYKYLGEDDETHEMILEEIPGATEFAMETEPLTENTTFVIKIYYAGEYYLCNRFSDPFEVEVKEEEYPEFVSNTWETCAGQEPLENPAVDASYTGVIWQFGLDANEDGQFDGTYITLDEANGNEMHFEDATLNPELREMLHVPGMYLVKVNVIDETGCNLTGGHNFLIKELPDVYITNNLTDDEAHYSDHMPEIWLEVCTGSQVELTGNGADSYVWDCPLPVADPTAQTIVLQPTTSGRFNIQVTGHSENTDCELAVVIGLDVKPLPTVAWVHPMSHPENYVSPKVGIDTVFSMMTEEFQLVATPEAVAPARGIYTYIVNGDPATSTPIEDGILRPSELQQYLGDTLQLIYNYTNEFGCINETRINVMIEKPYWTDIDKRDNNWFNNCLEAGKWEISDPYQMGAFAAYVNYNILDPEDQEGINFYDFANDTIYLTNDIDLLERPWFFRPLNEFKGVLDGAGKTLLRPTCLEDKLTIIFNGFIRNLGIRDAKATSTQLAYCYSKAGAKFHNSYATMPDFKNVKINPFLSKGDVQNVYYYGENPLPDGGKGLIAVYINKQGTPQFYEVENAALLTEIVPNEQYEGILEQWVWIANDWNYYTWVTDNAEENYGYPIFNTSFLHHHYVCYQTEMNFDFPESYNLDGVETRTIGETTYIYADHGVDVTLNIDLPKHVILNELDIRAHDYITMGNEQVIYNAANPTNPYTFTMPVDSVYHHAYYVTIDGDITKDYWTDEGNYNANWFGDCQDAGRFEITSNEDLAALAWMVNYGDYNFEGDTIYITGAVGPDDYGLCTDPEHPENQFLNMAAHLWDPIIGFAGVLDGTHFFIDSLYVRGGKMEEYADVNAMFADMSGDVRNLGIQDIDLPAGEAVFALTVEEPTFAPGTIYNSFFTNAPGFRDYRIADEGYRLVNNYILTAANNMEDGLGNGTNINFLNAWVNALDDENRQHYYGWIDDTECGINYDHPYHEHDIPEPGYPITYHPDINAQVNGFVSGPNTATAGTDVTVTLYPAPGYNCTDLKYTYTDNAGLQEFNITPVSNEAHFTMVPYPVDVWATFTPIDWTLTLYYMLEGTTTQVHAPKTAIYHYNDAINEPSPAVTGLVPLTDPYVGVMPNNHFVDTVFYTGDMFQILFCEDLQAMPYVLSYGTDHTGNMVQALTNATVNVELEAGWSFNVTITNLNTGEVIYDGGSNSITFEMPMSDVMVCLVAAEEYWDDFGIANIDWFIGHENDDEFILTKDSMLGGLAALVTGRPWLWEEGFYTEEQIDALWGENGVFYGKTFIVESDQDDKLIDLIEHKWRPIGAQIEFDRQFAGYFDGNGNKIINMRTADTCNLDVPGNGSCQGFFGNIGYEGVVNDLDIQGVAQGRYFTAGIAGVNFGKIINSVANVKVGSEFEAGGIVGNNYGYILNSYCMADTIECWSAAPAKATNNYYIGGIAAWNHGEGVIENCHNVAFLKKGSGYNPINYYGFLVGNNEGTLTNSYWKTYTGNGATAMVGRGTAGTNCAEMNANTAATMDANVAALATYGFDFFGWMAGTNGYPVFNRDTKAFMDINNTELNATLYPNPTRGNVRIACDNEIQKVTVFSMYGQMVLDMELNAYEATIDLGMLTTGTYMVRIATANGTIVKNVIVE